MTPARQLHGPPTVDPAARRLLLVSYHFPPGPAVGGLRWARFAPIAAELGWELDVITVDPEALSRRDDARLGELPASTRVFGVRPVRGPLARWRARHAAPAAVPGAPAAHPAEPAGSGETSVIPATELRWQLGRIEGWRRIARIALAVGRERAWSGPAARFGIELARQVRYDAIVSSGPPHQPHLAAVAIGRRVGRPVALDFRDPWAAVRGVLRGVASPLFPLLARRDERRALRAARLAVFNTDLATDEMRTRYPALADRFLTVMNGVDEDAPRPAPRDRFLIAYAGNIYIDRNPRTLFEAARLVIDELGLGPERFGIEFMGNADRLDGRTVTEIADASGLGRYFVQHPVGPRADAMAFLGRAAVLVSLPQSTALSIPSKVFEYLAFEAWPLVLAAPDTATARVFRGTSIPVVEPTDVAGIAVVLRDRCRRFIAGERPGPVAERSRFSRRGQAAIFFDALRRII